MLARRSLRPQPLVRTLPRRLLLLGAVFFIALVSSSAPAGAQEIELPTVPDPVDTPTIEVPDDPRGDARATVVGGAEGETGGERMGEREREARSASVAGVELDLDALFE